jgi:hypothetical protein
MWNIRKKPKEKWAALCIRKRSRQYCAHMTHLHFLIAGCSIGIQDGIFGVIFDALRVGLAGLRTSKKLSLAQRDSARKRTWANVYEFLREASILTSSYFLFLYKLFPCILNSSALAFFWVFVKGSFFGVGALSDSSSLVPAVVRPGISSSSSDIFSAVGALKDQTRVESLIKGKDRIILSYLGILGTRSFSLQDAVGSSCPHALLFGTSQRRTSVFARQLSKQSK